MTTVVTCPRPFHHSEAVCGDRRRCKAYPQCTRGTARGAPHQGSARPQIGRIDCNARARHGIVRRKDAKTLGPLAGVTTFPPPPIVSPRRRARFVVEHGRARDVGRRVPPPAPTLPACGWRSALALGRLFFKDSPRPPLCICVLLSFVRTAVSRAGERRGCFSAGLLKLPRAPAPPLFLSNSPLCSPPCCFPALSWLLSGLPGTGPCWTASACASRSLSCIASTFLFLTDFVPRPPPVRGKRGARCGR